MRRQTNPTGFGVEWAGVAEVVGTGVRVLWESGDGARSPLPEVEVYTDGSAALGKAGWGMVVVKDGVEVEAMSGPIEVGERTNNVAELMGVQRAVEWAVAHRRRRSPFGTTRNTRRTTRKGGAE